MDNQARKLLMDRVIPYFADIDDDGTDWDGIGNDVFLRIEKLLKINDKLQVRIEELEHFIDDLDEAKEFTKNSGGLQIPPIAGIFEKSLLSELKKIGLLEK